MKLLSLDLAKSRTGWALWHGDWPRPLSGSWVLDGTPDGRTFLSLHARLDELYQEHGFSDVYFEQAINHTPRMQGKTNVHAIELAVGLVAHVRSFAYARRRTPHAVHIDTWRLDFVGRSEIARIKDAAKARARALGKTVSARDDLKAATVARCRQLGFAPQSDDEADAIGVLDYAIALQQFVPPWRAGEVLRAPLGAVA